jgi:hypothetical protein
VAEWNPFQTQYLLENLVAPVTDPGPLDLKPGILTTRRQRWSEGETLVENQMNAVCRKSDVKGGEGHKHHEQVRGQRESLPRKLK